MRGSFASWPLVLFLLLAGCADSPGQPVASSSTAAPPAAPTEETGTIMGTITNEEALPLTGITVAIVETQAKTVSDVDGAFTFNGLTPGSYRLITEALGYESAARAATVVAAEVTSLNFSLKSIVIAPEPFHDMVPLVGTIQCSINPLYALNPCNGVTGQDKSQFKFEIPKGQAWNEAIFELVWTPATAATAQELELSVCDDTASNDPRIVCFENDAYYDYHTDDSPVIIRTNDMPVKNVQKYIVGAGSGLASPYPVFQQSFTIYMTHCYNGPCADDYTAIPPS